jgi:hypothetical protein
MATPAGAAATTPTTVVGTPTSPTAIDQQQLVPLNTMLAAAADVRRLDVQAMHEKVCGILTTIQAGNGAFAKKHGVKFYDNMRLPSVC